MIHSNHMRSYKQYWHDTNQCCQRRQRLGDVWVTPSRGRLFHFREIKQTELKGLVSSYFCTIIGEEMSAAEHKVSPLLTATKRKWTSTLWHWKKWKHRRKHLLGNVPLLSWMVWWACLLASCKVWWTVCVGICTGVTRAVETTGATATGTGAQVSAKGTGSGKSHLHSQNHLPVGWSNCQSWAL